MTVKWVKPSERVIVTLASDTNYVTFKNTETEEVITKVPVYNINVLGCEVDATARISSTRQSLHIELRPLDTYKVVGIHQVDITGLSPREISAAYLYAIGKAFHQ